MPLDGELGLGRKQFQRAVSIVRRQDQSDLWKELTYVVFDAPGLDQGFEARLEFVSACLRQQQPRHARAHEHLICRGVDHLRQELARLEQLGGEGLMLRRAGSRYEGGRSCTLLKVKRFHDAEARVLKHQGGAGRHQGRLGALLVEMADGTTFAVGTGFSDAERESPPPVGSLITFRYQELSEAGVPRFPSFVGVRAEGATPLTPGGEKPGGLLRAPGAARRFEFSEGRSHKFWEVAVARTNVTTRYGRIGASGQTSTKSFPDAATAAHQAEKLIAEKTGKGYHEVT